MEYPYKLSIITINLNNKKGLQKTIESIINQTCKDFEWIVIDGGSTDGSKEVIEKYQDYINFWVSEPDEGIYNAMNKGILVSKGKYLLFLNSGDNLYNIKVISNVLKRLNDKDIYIGNEVYDKNILIPNIDNIEERINLIFNLSLPHQAMFFKKDLFFKFGLYDTNLIISSDWEFYVKAILFYKCSLEKLPFIIDYFDTSGISRKKRELALKEREIILNNYPEIKFLLNFYKNNSSLIKFIHKNVFTRLFSKIYKLYYINIKK